MKEEQFSWLDGNSSRDLAIWREAWETLPERPPHYHPVFVRVMAPLDRHPTAAFYKGTRGSSVLYPFWLGKLGVLEGCPTDLVEYCDIVSPYGYGGPLYQGPQVQRETTVCEFRRLFRVACREHRVVSEFVREDLFRTDLVEDDGARVYCQDNVVVRLGLGEEAQLDRYDRKVRKNIRRAKEEGLSVVFDERAQRLDESVDVYHDTMRRVRARQYFFFGRSVFNELLVGLGPGRGAMLVHVLDGNRVVSTELLLCSRHRLYSFLGGTRQESKWKRPNDLLKHEIILWGGKMGFESYVLGGGAKPRDGIFRFKEAFDPGSTMPFFTRQRIHDSETYQRLVRTRRAAIREAQPSDFFPAYRD